MAKRPRRNYTDKDKAQAAALLAEGKSYRAIEDETGIEFSTVGRWRREDPTFRHAVEATRAPLEDLCGIIVHKGSQEIVRRLSDEKTCSEMSDADLNRYVGTAADKLVALERIRTPLKAEVEIAVGTPDELIERRRRLLESLGATVIDIGGAKTG